MADLPAPLIPTSATSGPREAPAVLETPPAASPSAAASSSDAVVPSAFATWARRAMEMLPAPDSSSARNRSETPQRSESARREKPRCSRAARTEAPMLARRASLERVAVAGRAVTWPCTILHGNGVRNRALGTILLCESAAPGVPSAPMEAKAAPPTSKTQFETHPDRYRHWTLVVEGDMARLTMEVEPFAGQDDKIQLKSNSYDLSVDIKLADAVQRLRFTHPEVKAVVVTSGHDRIFCAGANIYMLASSTHPFKVNFCKYTNETRLAIEEASAQSGQRYLAACNGATAGGGYELALACDQIVLVDDGSSTVALPEVPLLAVLPGTGGLTRGVDKRKGRRDLADAFSTLAEGVKGKRAVEWGLVDAVVPRSKFAETILQRAKALAAAAPQVARGPGIELDPLEPRVSKDRIEYRHVTLALDTGTRVATLTVRAPEGEIPKDAAGALARGAAGWGIRAGRA